MRLVRSLLWIDCSGGLFVGVLVLATAGWLSRLFGLPLSIVLVMGTANLVYGTFSFSLARRRVRPRALLQLLVAANITWALLCGVAAAVFASQASWVGLAHLILEGVYVGGLGLLEWKHLSALLTAQ